MIVAYSRGDLDPACHIGKGKAAALAAKYQCDSDSRYYSFGCIQHDANDWLFVCVDNNAARLAAIREGDLASIRATGSE